MKRRRFIKISTGALMILPGNLLGCGTKELPKPVSSNTDVIDEALKMMSDLAPLSNHGPMAAEALFAMGRGDRVMPFVESYRRNFSSDFPPRFKKITQNDWKEALDDDRRTTDWIDFFNREIDENGWKKTVDTWSNNLAPGLSAAAAHGLIRTGHAVRSLSRNENEGRKNELAQALAYWAAYYQVLPETMKTDGEKSDLPGALYKIPMFPPEKRVRGSIMRQLEALNDSFPEFGGVIGSLEIQGKPEQIISDLTEAFAEIYVRNVLPRNNVALIHSVTGLASVRSLVPYFSLATTERMLRYGWQAAAGIYSISGNEANNQEPADIPDIAGMTDQAATSNEVHAIKYTEACIREYKLNPKPIYLKAAKIAIGKLGRVR
ncbi:MAG: questin oxidase family protein [Pyrinomonadaceae bacterium]